jgi:hypothetical protein
MCHIRHISSPQYKSSYQDCAGDQIYRVHINCQIFNGSFLLRRPNRVERGIDEIEEERHLRQERGDPLMERDACDSPLALPPSTLHKYRALHIFARKKFTAGDSHKVIVWFARNHGND